MIIGFDLEKRIEKCKNQKLQLESYEFVRVDTWHKGRIQINPYYKQACYTRSGDWHCDDTQQITLADAKKLLNKGIWGWAYTKTQHCIYLPTEKPKKLNSIKQLRSIIDYYFCERFLRL